MEFVLFEKLKKLSGLSLYLFIGVLAAAVVLVAVLAMARRRPSHTAPANARPAKRKFSTLILAQGALCVSMSFVLSYIKLFSMPMGGSITLCSMMPLAFFSVAYGPAYGCAAAFVYSLLQLVQDPYVIHWAQLILDYFLAFTCYGLAGFCKRRLPLGVAVAGFSRMALSTVSGVVFFADSAAEAGYGNALVYSLFYNGSTIGADTVLCIAAACLPAIRRLLEQFRLQSVKGLKTETP